MRFLSLDVFRGMTLILMLIVKNPGDWGAVYAPIQHMAGPLMDTGLGHSKALRQIYLE